MWELMGNQFIALWGVDHELYSTTFSSSEVETLIPWTQGGSNSDYYTATGPISTTRSVSVTLENYQETATIVMWRVYLTCTMTPSAAENQLGDNTVNSDASAISYVYIEPRSQSEKLKWAILHPSEPV